jgi:hypothetical protein
MAHYLKGMGGTAKMRRRLYIYKQHPRIFRKIYGPVINIKKISIVLHKYHRAVLISYFIVFL